MEGKAPFLTKYLICVILLLGQLHGYKGCVENERKALLELKKYIISITKEEKSGSVFPTWTDDTKSDCCLWEVVVCNQTSRRVTTIAFDTLDLKENSLLNLSLLHPFEDVRSLNLSGDSFGFSGLFDDVEDMSEELPKRIFNEGDEPQVTQINNNCRIDYIIKKFEKWMPKEFADVKKDPVFSQVFKLHENGLGYSARVIHSILCRELLTYMMHELWFVFARRPHRFSLQEFHAVTGFECRTSLSLKIDLEDYAYDGGFWSKVLKRKDESITLFNLWNKDKAAVMKWKNADRIRLIYLAIILCVVLARDEKANIPLKYITLVMDLEKFRKYPWGVAAYDLLCSSIAKNRHKLKEKTTSYVLDGFSYALQIWAMEAVPKIGKLCGKKLDKSFANGPRCINWRGAAKVSYDEINRLEQIFTTEDVSYPYISWEGNMVVIQSQEFRRDDDVEDDRINVVMELIRAKHDFSEHIWEFEETEVSLDLNDEAPANVEAAESEEEFETPQGSNNVSSTSRRGKKRVPDRGMEKRKHKVLSSAPKQAPFNEDMKAFVTQLFEDNFSAMEKRLQKQMSETFEQMKSDLIASRKEASVEVEHGGPSPSKATTSQPPLRRSTRGVKKL